MNGYPAGRTQYNDGARGLSQPSSHTQIKPDIRRQDASMNDYSHDAPTFEPASGTIETLRSAHVDLKDPIQIHLLTETALSDSKGYEILSQEELDELKKQAALLSQRVESTRSNLAIQSKYRDAAASMARLSMARLNVLDHDDPEASRSRAAERERIECDRKCDELATELLYLEKQLLIPHRKIVEHTAAILQLTHKATAKKNALQNGQTVNGIPGSPESLYTYSQSRSSLDQIGDDHFFGEATAYQLMGGARKNSIQAHENSHNRQQEAVAARESQIGERLESMNLRLRDLLMAADPHYTPSSLPAESDVDGQMAYLEDSLQLVDSHLAQGGTSNTHDDTSSVLTGLWGTMQRGLAEAQKRKEDRRKARAEKGIPDDDEDMSDNEGLDTEEDYSLDSFATRVHWVHSQAITLREQKYVLKRQIKQQRELNNKSDAEKDGELSRKQAEMEQTRQLLTRAEKDAADAQKALSSTMADLEVARKAANAAGAAETEIQERNAKIAGLEKDLEAAQKQLASVESGNKSTTDKLAEYNSQVEQLTQDKKIADEAVQDLQKQLTAKEKEIKSKADDAEQMNMTLAELKTEVTIARAELDGAYGTRAERAADVAAIKESAEVQKLQNQVDRLKKELTATLEDLEGVTKETIGSEKEKADLEAQLDDALAAKGSLETDMQRSREKVAKLQEELDSERLKIPSDGTKPGAGASMLSDRFRATMREERKRFQEDLREERARCRKLEEELGRLKRINGPGKSPLSPR